MDLQEIADGLLAPIWRGVDADYKRRYSYSIWQQFESQIRSAAYTSSVSRFFDRIQQRLAVQIRSEDQAATAGVINADDQRAVLKRLREETATLVLMVRIANDKRKEK